LGQAGAILGVDYILEGTVRWEGGGNDAVRITATLVRVADDRAIWSENYDRDLENMFAVQSDIAERVLDRIGIVLQEAQSATAAGRGTDNTDAYDAYLRGSEFLLQADELDSEEQTLAAVDNFERATELDPEFALAWAKLAMTHNFAYQRFFDRSEERRELTRDAVGRALDIAPDLPEAHLAFGKYHRSGMDYDLALNEFELAARGRPGDSQFVQAIAELNWHSGNIEPAIEAYERAFLIDPQRSVLYCNLGGVHRLNGDFDAALETHAHAISIRPERVCPYYCVAYTTLHAEGVESARAYLETLPEDIGLDATPPIDYVWFLVEIIQGHHADALTRLADDPGAAYDWQHFYYPKSLLRGQVYLFMGDEEQARQQFERAAQLLEGMLAERRGDARLHSSLGIAYAGLGRDVEAVAAGKLGIDMLPYERDKFLGPYRLKDMAQIYAMVDDTENALNSLEILMSIRSLIHIAEIHDDPTWIALRGNPRFEALGSG